MSRTDEEFWKIAAEEIEQGEEVTVMGTNGHAIACSTLPELWRARAELEEENATGSHGDA